MSLNERRGAMSPMDMLVGYYPNITAPLESSKRYKPPMPKHDRLKWGDVGDCSSERITLCFAGRLPPYVLASRRSPIIECKPSIKTIIKHYRDLKRGCCSCLTNSALCSTAVNSTAAGVLPMSNGDLLLTYLVLTRELSVVSLCKKRCDIPTHR